MEIEHDPLEAEFLQRLRQGDDQAAQHIFERFAGRLTALARSRMSGLVRGQVDPEDIVQSVFRSFFVRQSAGEFSLQGWDRMWSLLAMITLRKCGHRAEYFYAACRDVHRHAHFSEQPESIVAFEAIARDPTPLESALLEEAMREMFAAFDPRQRRIIEMRLQGADVAEISTAMECTERTVQRALKSVHEWLKDRLEVDR
jgi:RNA polymerase sigma-70 factor (ECF subfamily)